MKPASLSRQARVRGGVSYVDNPGGNRRGTEAASRNQARPAVRAFGAAPR